MNLDDLYATTTADPATVAAVLEALTGGTDRFAAARAAALLAGCTIADGPWAAPLGDLAEVDIDIETIRIAPGSDIEVPWEVAVLTAGQNPGDPAREFCWQIRPNLEHADPTALRIGRYQRRIHPALRRAAPGTAIRITHPTLSAVSDDPDPLTVRMSLTDADQVADELAQITDDVVLWGSNVGRFDDHHLEAWMRRHGQCPSWHYHPDDTVSMVKGWCAALGITPPGSTSDAWSLAVGVDPRDHARHSASGDCWWGRRLRYTMRGWPLDTPEVTG